MRVNIWSDIRCPFCYIGKHKFEIGLSQFAHKDKIEVIWHSFELDSALETDTTLDVYDYLAKLKGQSRDWSIQVHNQVKESAHGVGLEYDFDKTVIANSYNAHRLIQFAKTKNLGNFAEEALFHAYFAKGKNIDDSGTLIEVGSEIGLNADQIEEMLSSGAYAKEVRYDEDLANKIGINGVPFFVLNNKYAISGAQAPEIFLSALQEAWKDYENENPELKINNAVGDQCDVGEPCSIRK